MRKYLLLFLCVIILSVLCCKKNNNVQATLKKNQVEVKDSNLDENTKKILDSLNAPEIVDNFIEDGLDIGIDNYTKDYIQNKYGVPKDYKLDKTINRYDKNVNDNIHELFYDGFYIKLYERTSDKHFLLMGMEISNDNITMRNGIKINDEKNKIIQIFGKNATLKNDNISIGSQGGNVNFLFKDNKLAKVTWIIYS